MVTIREIFKKSTSKTIEASKEASKSIAETSKSITKGTNTLLDLDILKLKFIIHWFFALIFFVWAIAYTIYTFYDFTFYPKGWPSPKVEVSSLIFTHYIFSIFILYYIIIFTIFFKRAMKGNNQKLSFKFPIALFILNVFVLYLSNYALYIIHGYPYSNFWIVLEYTFK